MIDVHHRQWRKVARVSLPVTDETGLLRKRLVAHVALVESFAGVQKQMLAETTVSGEGFFALRAFVRSVARVDPHVLSEIVALLEGLAALLAHRLLLLFVLRHYVPIEILLRDHASLADRALVLGLVMGVLLMSVQTVTVPATLAAHVANHVRFYVLQPDVRRAVALDLEFLVAEIARVLVRVRVFAHEMRVQSLLASEYLPAHGACELGLVVGDDRIVDDHVFDDYVVGLLVLLSQMRDQR